MKLLLTSTVQFFAPKLAHVFGNDLSNMNVLYIPTAAYAQAGYEEFLTPELNAIRPLVKSLVEFDIKGKSATELTAALKGIDVLYVTGGNTYCLLEAMNKIGFKDILISFLQSGGIYLGSSAGSIVTGPDIGFIGTMDDPSQSSLMDYTAMQLVDFLVLPHMNQDNFRDLGKQIIESYQGDHETISLNDDQAIWVEGNSIQMV